MPETRLPSPFALDNTPLDTDWDSLDAIFADMKKVADEHPESKVMAADDPGCGCKPPRVGRLGWILIDPTREPGDDYIKRWTITLGAIMNLHRKGKLGPPMKKALLTAAGRKTLVDGLLS